MRLVVFFILLVAVAMSGTKMSYLNKCAFHNNRPHFIDHSHNLVSLTNIHFTQHPLRIIIAGAPAAGKGTQCKLLQSHFAIDHISSGDILRAAVAENSEIGKQVKSYMDNGLLVPDDLVTKLVCDKLRQINNNGGGWLMDGFPRTKAQAHALQSAGVDADCFILLDVDQEQLLDRVLGRRLDPMTGHIYHLKHNPPDSEEVLARLVQRDDDTAEKIVKRYDDFQKHIEELTEVFEGIVVRVDGNHKSQSDIHSLLVAKLSATLMQKQQLKQQPAKKMYLNRANWMNRNRDTSTSCCL